MYVCLQKGEVGVFMFFIESMLYESLIEKRVGDLLIHLEHVVVNLLE